MSSWRRTRFVDRPVYIPTSGSPLSLEVVTKSYDANGPDTITPSTGYDAISRVELDIDVPIKFTGMGISRDNITWAAIDFSTTPSGSSDDLNAERSYNIPPGYALFFLYSAASTATFDSVRQVHAQVAANFTSATLTQNVDGQQRAWLIQMPTTGTATVIYATLRIDTDTVVHGAARTIRTDALSVTGLTTDLTNVDFN